MSTMLTEIASYLATQGQGTLDQTLFKSYLPDDGVPRNTTVAALLEYPGPPPVETLVDDAYMQQRFQVLVRGPDYPTAWTKAETIRRILHAIANKTLSGTRYLRVRSLQSSPAPLGGEDEFKRWIMVVNYEAQRHE